MTQTMQLGRAADQSFIGRVRNTLARRTEGRGVALLAVILIGVALFEPLVFTAYQVSLGRIALIGIVALGLTAVILMGELDLSVASTLALSGVVMALIPDIWLGILAALATGLIVGARESPSDFLCWDPSLRESSSSSWSSSRFRCLSRESEWGANSLPSEGTVRQPSTRESR